MTPEIDRLLHAETEAQMLQRDPAMHTWLDLPNAKAFAYGRVERGLAPPPRAASATTHRATTAPKETSP